MARRKLSNKNIRKLSRIGDKSIKEKDELVLINKLFDVFVELFSNRYKDIVKTKKKLEDFIKEIINR